MTKQLPDSYLSRKAEIVAQFNQILDNHLNDFLAGRVEKMYGLQEIAALICLHPVHLSNVIKLETGHHACYFYEQRILAEAKKLLADLDFSTIKSRTSWIMMRPISPSFSSGSPGIPRRCTENSY